MTKTMICLTLKPRKFLCLPYIKQRKIFYWRWSERLNKRLKEGFLTALTLVIKKDPIMSMRKHTNKLKVHKKTMRTAIKQDLSPDHNYLGLVGWGCRNNWLHLCRGVRLNECLGYDTKWSGGEVPVMLELLSNVQYPFIAIAPWSFLAQSGSTW